VRLYVIRHAQSLANAEGRLQGHLDFALTELGHDQCARLAERLAGEGVETLYSSPLGRARTTAEAIAERLRLPIHALDGLRERDVGEIAGLTRAEILERFPHYVHARARVQAVEIAGFEQDSTLAGRVAAAFDQITGGEGERVAIVSHGGVIGAFCRAALGMPLVRPSPFAIDNASITVFELRERRAQLVTMNDTCHLHGLGH
jgi:broad specificity phosphatase PhoE